MLVLNFVVLVYKLCICNVMVYFIRNLFYKKLCNNKNILLVNTNINWFPLINNEFCEILFYKKLYSNQYAFKWH